MRAVQLLDDSIDRAHLPECGILPLICEGVPCLCSRKEHSYAVPHNGP